MNSENDGQPAVEGVLDQMQRCTAQPDPCDDQGIRKGLDDAFGLLDAMGNVDDAAEDSDVKAVYSYGGRVGEDDDEEGMRNEVKMMEAERDEGDKNKRKRAVE